MNEQKVKIHIQGRIAALRQLLEEAEAGCDTVALDQTRVGRLSRMDAMQSQSMNQAAQLRRRHELERLNLALQRIDEEDYGYCEDCGERISEGRLLLDPAALYCVHCAGQREQEPGR